MGRILKKRHSTIPGGNSKLPIDLKYDKIELSIQF